MIGLKVKKISGKPFKSGLKFNTISGTGIHPKTKRATFLFEEDDSYVECKQCIVINVSEVFELVYKQIKKLEKSIKKIKE